MFATPAYAQAASGAAASGDGIQGLLLNFAPLVLIMVMGYFVLWRPQQQRAKKHQEQVAGIKRGDTVILSSGLIGQVVRVEDKEAVIEISPKVEVKVIKSMIADVRVKGAPVAANDAKG